MWFKNRFKLTLNMNISANQYYNDTIVIREFGTPLVSLLSIFAPEHLSNIVISVPKIMTAPQFKQNCHVTTNTLPDKR